MALVASTAGTSASPLQCPLRGEGPTTELVAAIVGTQGDDVIPGTDGQAVIVVSAVTTGSGASVATT